MVKRKRDGVLKIKPIPVPFGYQHPDPSNPVLPTHEFTMGIIAPKGSGKTTLIANLLEFYKGYFHNIIVFSPTIASDEKWDYVKRLDLIVENVPLKKWLKQMEEDMEDDNPVVESRSKGHALQGLVDPTPLLDKKIPEENFHTVYDEQLLKSMVQDQMDMVTILKHYGQPKYLANRILFILDDLVGSSLFGNHKKNVFKGFNTRHRHASASIIMVTQAYKEIPKAIRTNFSCLILFEIPNEKELEVIYEENSLYMKKPLWYEAYHYAVDGDYDFMFINYQKKQKRLRMMKNFEQVIFVGD